MKIAFVNGPGNGGSENMTFLFASILRNAGNECRALILQNQEETEMSPNIPDGMPVETVTCRFRHYFIHLACFLVRNKPDCVFSSMPDRSILLLLTRLAGIYKGKIVIREGNMPSRFSFWIRLMSKLLYSYADMLIAQTEEMKQEMLQLYKLPDAAVCVIHNPLNVAHIRKCAAETFMMDRDKVNFLSVGRLARQKDQLTLLDAFRIIHDSHPECRLYIVGGDNELDYAEMVRQKVIEYGLSDVVFFEGFQHNPIKYMAACDVYVLSSIYEGFPNSLQEALYLGKPVVVTSCIPQIGRMVKNGVNGYVCSVGHYEEMAEAMSKAIELKEPVPFDDDLDVRARSIVEIFSQLCKEQKQ